MVGVRMIVLFALLALGFGVRSLFSQEKAVIAPSATRENEQLALDQLGDPLPAGAIARLGTTRLRMVRRSCLAISPDGKTIALPNSDGTLSLWESATGKELRVFGEPADRFSCVSYSGDGKTLVGGGSRGVRLWNVATGKEISKFAHPSISCVAFSPDGKILASGCFKHEIRIWDLASGKEKFKLLGQNTPVSTLAFSRDGNLLASGGGFLPSGRLSADTANICLWHAKAGKLIRSWAAPSSMPVTALSFSPCGKTLATAASQRFHLWMVPTGKMLLEKKDDMGYAVAFSPDGKMVAVGGSNSYAVQLLDPATGKTLRHFPKLKHYAASLAFSHDGRILASVGVGGVCVWNVETGKEVLLLPGHAGNVTTMSYSSDGGFLASAAEGFTVRLWDTRTAREVRQFTLPLAHRIMRVAISPDGKTLAVANSTYAIHSFDLATGKKLLNFQTPGCVQQFAFSPDGTVLAVPIEEILHLYAMPMRKEIHRINVRVEGEIPCYIRALAFSANGKLLASARDISSVPGPPEDFKSRDVPEAVDTIHLWDVKTAKLRGKLTGHPGTYGLAMSPDGRMLASIGVPFVRAPSMGTIRLWETASGKAICEINAHEGSVNAITFSPNGRMLLSGGDDAIARLWDPLTGKEIGKFGGHLGTLFSLAWSPDSRYFASGSGDSSILLWKCPAGNQEGDGPSKAGKTPEQLWNELGAGDPAVAYRAIYTLLGSPKEAAALLKRRLQPSANVEEKGHQINKLIRDLNSATFAVRESAFQKLKNLEQEAAPALKQALLEKSPLEVQRRLQLLLKALPPFPLPGDKLQSIRAIQVLEWIDSPESRRVLAGLVAQGAPWTRQTHEAKAALERLDKNGAIGSQ